MLSSRARLTRFIAYRKELLLTICVLLSAPAMLVHIPNVTSLASMIAVPTYFLVLWLAIVGGAYERNMFARWSIAAVFAISAYFLIAFVNITKSFMIYDAFINMMTAAGFAVDALFQYRAAFIKSLIPSLLLLFGIGLQPNRLLRVPPFVLGSAPWLAVCLMAVTLYARGGTGAQGQPPAVIPLSYLALMSYDAWQGDVGVREPVLLIRSSEPRVRNIVLIVDESISGQYLDINSTHGVPTPLSRTWSNLSIYNYGLAASITNCSAGSNFTLRHGGTRTHYRSINALKPSIFSYAKSAGLETIYIDAQETGGTLQNMMTVNEREAIDRFVQFDKIPVVNRDIAASDLLLRLLQETKPKFILINKVGAHFPIHDKYPDHFMYYRPALARGHFIDIAHTGDRTGYAGRRSDWVEYRNAYRNTLSWNVGEFFERVLSQGQLSGTTIIYTSDHGQDLHERGNAGQATHCTPNPNPEEGTVPLLVIEGHRRSSGMDWASGVASNHGAASHYMIFPTLLSLMGYDRRELQRVYGASLDEPARDPMTFNAEFNARLGREPVWIHIDPSVIIQPSDRDFR